MIEAIKQGIANLDSFWVLSSAIGALVYAVFDNRDTCDEIRDASGWKKNALRLKFTLLWAVPVIGLIGWYSASVSSEMQDRSFSEATNRLAQLESRERDRELTPEKHKALVECLRAGTVGPVLVGSDELSGPKGIAEALKFKQQITRVLLESGFRGPNSRSNVLNLISFGPPGVSLIVKDINNIPPHARSIQSCFRKHGILPSDIGHYDFTNIPESNIVVLWVSEKP